MTRDMDAFQNEYKERKLPGLENESWWKIILYCMSFLLIFFHCGNCSQPAYRRDTKPFCEICYQGDLPAIAHHLCFVLVVCTLCR